MRRASYPPPPRAGKPSETNEKVDELDEDDDLEP